MPYLAFNLNDGNEFVFDILEERLTIGRDAKNDIVVDNTCISAFHAELIRKADEVYELLDLKSSNGTFVNGQRTERIRVKPGDKIRFGELDCRFRDRGVKSPPSAGANAPAMLVDGRRGDTESIPIRNAPGKSAKAKTSPIPTHKKSAAKQDSSTKVPTISATHGMLIQRPGGVDPAIQKQAEELRDEVAKLKAERDNLKKDKEKETRLREEVRSLEKQIKERQKTSDELETKVASLKKAAESSPAKANAGLSNGTAEADTKTLDTRLGERKTELTKLQDQIASLRQEETALSKRVQELADQEARLSSMRDALKEAEAQKTDLTSALSRMAQERDALNRELLTATEKGRAQHTLTQTLTTRREALEKELKELEEKNTSITTALEKATETLGITENSLTARQEELKTTEAKAAEAAQQQADLKKELVTLQEQVAQATSEKEKISSEAAARKQEAETAVAATEKHNAQSAELQGKITALEALLVTLTATQTTRQQEITTAEKKAAELADQITSSIGKLSSLEATAKGTQEQLTTQEKRLAELTGTEAKLAETQASLTTAGKDLEKIQAQLTPLQTELADLEQRLPSLRKESQALRADMEVLLRDKQASSAALEKAQGDRKSAQDQAETLRAEAANLEKLLADQSKKAKTEEARVADVEARLQKATDAAQAAETKRTEAEAVISKARDEEKQLRKQIPALNTELASLQTMLTSLTKEREEASQFVTRLNVATENANKRLGEVQQQISQLEAAHQVREDRLMKAQEEVDKEAARLKAAQEATAAAQQVLQDLEKEVRESRQRTEAARTQSTGLEAELHTRMDRVEKLKLEETRLLKEVESQKVEAQGAAASLAEIQDKIRHEETLLAEFTQVGGKVLTLGAALISLEARQSEAAKSLRDAAERELSLQVKINSLQESFNRETLRMDQIKSDRTAMETELGTFKLETEKQTATLQAQEIEKRKTLADLEVQLRDHSVSLDRLKAEIETLNGRRAEFAQAEAQLKHWQEIEARLRGQLLELEEKHEVLRRGLTTEESTVVIFANDIIKRIDLIDALGSRYASHNGGDVAAQLRTLRHSFEDILLQHGISEFDIPSGTEVDVELRKRITIVESIPGKNKPQVVETCRSGFIYSREEGHELILRKVEVKTSSQ